jgi:hypothetical protein
MISPSKIYEMAAARAVLPEAVGPVTTNKSYAVFNSAVTFSFIQS